MNYQQIIKALYDLEYIETIKMKDKIDTNTMILITLEDNDVIHLHFKNSDKNNILRVFIAYKENAMGQVDSLLVDNIKFELYNKEMSDILNEKS